MRQASAHRQHPLAVRLRKLRAERGLTLREVAERADKGMSGQQVSRFELGRRLPSIDSLVQLARGLGVKCADIISCLDEAEAVQASDREANALGGAIAHHEDARQAQTSSVGSASGRVEFDGCDDLGGL